MKESLKGMESKRKSLYEKLKTIGDFRHGTISVNYRKCGKKNCICAKPEHPGHGPQYLWNTTIKGKSYAKNLKLGPELKKYRDEIANYQEFLKLCDETVQLNENICNLRPVPEVENESEAEELKKKLKMHFRKGYKKRLIGS